MIWLLIHCCQHSCYHIILFASVPVRTTRRKPFTVCFLVYRVSLSAERKRRDRGLAFTHTTPGTLRKCELDAHLVDTQWRSVVERRSGVTRAELDFAEFVYLTRRLGMNITMSGKGYP